MCNYTNEECDYENAAMTAATTCSCNCDDRLDCCNCDDCADTVKELSICTTLQGGTTTVGSRGRAYARFNASYTGNRQVVWGTNDPSVVKIDCYGNLTAVGEGTTYIYVYVHGKPSVHDILTIHVTANGSSSSGGSMTIDLLDNEFHPLAEILSDGPWVMYMGEKYQFRYSIRNKVGTPEVSWSVSDNSTLHVNDNGEITALRVGSSELTVKIVGSDSNAQCNVMVEVIENSDNPIIFNTIHFDQIWGIDENTDEYADLLPSDLVVKYYCGKISQFKIEKTNSPASNWAENEIYGTNASFFGGGKCFSAAHVYEGVSLQDQYDAEDTERFRNGDEPTPNAFGLLLFENDGTPHIFTNQYFPPCLNGSEEQMRVADMKFAIGGIDLFGDQSLDSSGFNTCFINAYDGFGGAFSLPSKRHRTVIGYDSQTDRIVLAIMYRERSNDFNATNSKKLSNLYDQVSFFQARQVMKYLHCDKILNIDGGSSTQMSFKVSGNNDYLINANSNVYACVRVKEGENDKIVWSE